MNAVAKPRARILLVDDSMLMRKAASKMLGEEFDVVSAVDGEDAWGKIQTDNTIQVVFTDLSMPKMDGYALLRTIRDSEDEGTLNMPVIVVTGAENDEAARKKALDEGATDFITKPFSSVDLLARARAHANYRRIARKLEEQITVDSLTGLANKAGLLDRLQQDVAFARRHTQPLSVARIEVDAFREIFLKHGKARAEGVIQFVARFLHEKVRLEDTCARIGLASFALSLPGGQHTGSKGLIDRMRAQIAGETVNIDGAPIRITISAALLTPDLRDSPSASAVLDACERLVQTAVKAGGNCVLDESPDPFAGLEAAPDLVAALPEPVAPPKAAPPKAAAPPPKSAPPPPAPKASKPVAAPAAMSTAEPETRPEAVFEAPRTEAPEPLEVVLHRIERGEGSSVLAQLPHILKRLLPVFSLLSPRQRGQLVAYLQKLGI